MFQVPVSAIQDTFNYSKKKASYLILVLVIIAGLPSALSYSQINLSLNNIPILDIVDSAFGTYGISISAAIFSVIVTWYIDKKKLIEQANLYSNSSNKIKIPENIVQLIKFGLPILITLTIIVGFVTKCYSANNDQALHISILYVTVKPIDDLDQLIELTTVAKLFSSFCK
jgi:neurotransmitter:Na+ symporter, NSS family